MTHPRIARTALAAVCLLWGCEKKNPADQGAADPYLIGALYPTSGVAARYGEDSVVGAELAMHEVNAAGGINGRPLKLLFRDTAANAQQAKQLAREFVVDKQVDFLMGVVSSSAALAVSSVSEETKTIFVGTDHASSRLTYREFQPFYFRVSNNTYQSMAAQALYASKQDWRRYYIIGPDYEYGHALRTDFVALMNEQGASMEVVGESWPKLFEPDYTSHISAIRAAQPDVIVVGLWGGDLISFIRQANSVGLLDAISLLSCDGGGNYEIFEALGDQLPTGLVLSGRHHNNWPETAANRRFVRAFEDATGRYPGYAAQGAYVGVHFIAKALAQQPDEDDTEALISVMESLRIQCPEDPPGFTSYMDPYTHQMIQMHAIGVTVANSEYPPATRMLGQWEVFNAELLVPSREEVDRRRAAGGG